MDRKCTIVIPTLGNRQKELERAVASLLEQTGGQAMPLVVLNGERYDGEFVRHLRQRRDIRFLQIDGSGVSRARYEGRLQVDTPYYGFLDDDDEYTPDALAIRFRPFETRPETDVAVGNGWHHVGMEKRLVWQDPAPIEADPAHVLMTMNWLGSCSAIFKTETVGPEYFDFDFQYFEWTYLALHLALTRKLAFTREPTFIVNNTPNSLSDSDAYGEAYTAMLDNMLTFDMPRSLRQMIRKRILAGHHNMSDVYRRRGVMSAAWKYHLRSLSGLHGLLQYGLYTGKLLAPSTPRAD